jgi:hypothetical protein
VIIFCFILDKFTLFFSLVNRSNTKVCLRVDECEGSNPSSREESLAGGCTVFNLHVFELIINRVVSCSSSSYHYCIFMSCWQDPFVVREGEQRVRTKGHLEGN